jgi:dienelactone hydrolase
MSVPGIDLLAAPPEATDLVLLAHGGVVESVAEPHAWRAPILRMWPFALAARAAAPGAAVGLMRYRYRGWNGGEAHPAADLRTVLEVLPSRIRRVLLVGHSMGGRAVVAAGNHSLVAGVLGLAPWLPPDEPVVKIGGPVVLAHGTLDRITDPALTGTYAGRLRAAGVPVALLSVEDEKHAMLRRATDWDDLVHRFVLHAFAEPPAPCEALTTTVDRVDTLPRWNRPTSIPVAVRSIAAARLRLRVTDHF